MVPFWFLHPWVDLRWFAKHVIMNPHLIKHLLSQRVWIISDQSPLPHCGGVGILSTFLRHGNMPLDRVDSMSTIWWWLHPEIGELASPKKCRCVLLGWPRGLHGLVPCHEWTLHVDPELWDCVISLVMQMFFEHRDCRMLLNSTGDMAPQTLNHEQGWRSLVYFPFDM